MGNVHVFNIGIICIHGKELLRQLPFPQEYKRSHTAKLVSGDEQIIYLQRAKVYVFSDSVLER